jgi:hypothetical protein
VPSASMGGDYRAMKNPAMIDARYDVGNSQKVANHLEGKERDVDERYPAHLALSFGKPARRVTPWR